MTGFVRTDTLTRPEGRQIHIGTESQPKKPIVVMLTHESDFVYGIDTHPSFLTHLDVRSLFPKSCLACVPPKEIAEALRGAAWLVLNPSHRSMHESTEVYASEKFAVDCILAEGCKTQLAVLHTIQNCVDPPYMHSEEVWKRLKAVAHLGLLGNEASRAYTLAERFDLHFVPGPEVIWSNLNDRAEMHRRVPENIGLFAEGLVRLAA